VQGQIGASAKVYGRARPEVLGTIWWYSLSSVLVGPALESLVHTRAALDPSLEAITLELLTDGRFAGARSSRVFGGDLAELGAAMAGTLVPAIATIATVSGARVPALRSIATDSIGNRLLWAGSSVGDTGRAMALAGPLIGAIGLGLPKPRFLQVGSTSVVRRASCCLIYKANSVKCTSCPRQTPEQRLRRLRAALG
jgi:ferric iron reductase protein FhuF